MQNSQVFIQNKCQILQNKKQYLQQHIQQLENSVASVWEANQLLKSHIQQLRQNPNHTSPHNRDQTDHLDAYQSEERQKIRKLDELKRLIQQYKFLCSEAASYTSAKNEAPSFTNENHSLNRSLTPSRSRKKITTKLYCQQCETHFFPQQYYRHCQEKHGQEPGYHSLRA